MKRLAIAALLSFSLCISAIAQTPSSVQAAINAFIAQINGINWNNKSGLVTGPMVQTLFLTATSAETALNTLWTTFAPGQYQPILGFTPAQGFNITDSVGGLPGAKCDWNGTTGTNDDAAINRTLAAAAASSAYQTEAGVKIFGPGNSRRCKYNSLNFTIFNLGNGSAPYPVDISELNLFCTGVAKNCFDMSTANYLNVHEVSITGDSSAIPETCFQLATLTGVSSAHNKLTNVQCHGTFGLTDLLNTGSEDDIVIGSTFENNNSTVGPIGSIGTITAGGGGTSGTYTGVGLTGSVSGQSGALATIVVNGDGTVHAGGVTITYQGRRYVPTDVLTASPSAIGNTTGFSVPVASIHNFTTVVDGYDYWNVHSDFSPSTITPGSALSQTLDTFINVNMRQAGAGGTLWTAHTSGLRTINSYCYNGAALPCVEFYDNGNGQQNGTDLELNIEGSSPSAFLLEGPNTSQIISDFRWRGYHQAQNETFAAAPNIVSVALNPFDVDLFYTTPAVPMFDTPSLYSCSGGHANLHATANWNGTSACNLALNNGTLTSTPAIIANGSLLPSANNAIELAGLVALSPSLSGAGGREFLSSVNGLSLLGFGSTFDISLKNRGNGAAAGVLANTNLFGVTAALTAVGTVPTPTGTCAVSTPIGGMSGGSFSASAPCVNGTVILAFSQAAPTGWYCDAHDETTATDILNQTANSSNSVTFSGSMASADVIVFKCMAY
jgi:hypothetical protein